MSKESGKTSALGKKLPYPGPDRFWRVRHIPTQRTNPIRVELMESQVPGSTKLCTFIGYENTVAGEKAILEAAQIVLDRVGAFQELIGDYHVQ